MSMRDEFEEWIADFMGAEVDHFRNSRYTKDDMPEGYYFGLSEWYGEDADHLATMGWKAWQAAREQGGE